MLDSKLASYREECQKLEQAIAANPYLHESHYRLSSLRLLISVILRERADNVALITVDLNRALDAITQALRMHPANDSYWTHFAECITRASLQYPLDPLAREILTHALEHPAIQPLALVSPIVGLVRNHPLIPDLTKYLLPQTDVSAADEALLLPRIGELFREPLLLRLLALSLVPDPFIERLIVLARRLVLRTTVACLAEAPQFPLAAIAAIAHQCHATEYIYDVSDEENAGITALQDAIASRRDGDGAVPVHWYAMLACFRPLNTLIDAERLPDLSGATELRGLLRTQIVDPAEERRLRGTIDGTTVATNPVSLAVGSLYEANPYPRWLKTVKILSAGGLHEQLRQMLPRTTHPLSNETSPSILVAGCGTGQQSIETAQRYGDARVLAIDLSLASLCYAKRKTLELGLDNLEYRHCDILELSSLQERFDLIESIGVLHHLEEPLCGWRALRHLLKPNGIMRIGLYSEIARRELIPFFDIVAKQRLNPDIEGIRRCRAQIRTMTTEQHALSLNFSPDFYCASGCRDMLFHVKEHRYSLPQIDAMLDQLDLRFLGFDLSTIGLADRYRAEFPEDVEMTRLDYWHRFETANPWMFKGLCKFWVQSGY